MLTTELHSVNPDSTVKGLRESVGITHGSGDAYNADLNGTMNIGKRFWEQTFQDGATGSTPVTLPEPNPRTHDEERSYQTKQYEA